MPYIFFSSACRKVMINSFINFYLQHLDESVVPPCECLKDTVERAIPYWHDAIVPAMKVFVTLILAKYCLAVLMLNCFSSKLSEWYY